MRRERIRAREGVAKGKTKRRKGKRGEIEGV